MHFDSIVIVAKPVVAFVDYKLAAAFHSSKLVKLLDQITSSTVAVTMAITMAVLGAN